MGIRPGCNDPVDTGQDEVMVDNGLRVGYCGREADSPVCLIGHPSGELQIELARHFGIERKINWPSVILDNHKNPIFYDEDDDDREE